MANADFRYGVPLPSFGWFIEAGAVCALNFPVDMNPGLAKALGVMMKLDFQRAVLNRIPEIEAHLYQYFRQVLFLCDEYHHFATVGESEPTGDEKFFSLSRQPKCIPIPSLTRKDSSAPTVFMEVVPIPTLSPFTQRLLFGSWTPASPLPSKAARASHGPDEIDEYAFVVVLQIGQVVGEVGEVVADASLQVLANVMIDRGQRAAAALTYIR